MVLHVQLLMPPIIQFVIWQRLATSFTASSSIELMEVALVAGWDAVSARKKLFLLTDCQ